MAPLSPTPAWPRSWPAPSRCAPWQRTTSCSCRGNSVATWASSVAGVGSRLYVAALARYPAARLVEDNLVLNTGSRLVFECTAAPPGTCLVFGDSYSLGPASVPRGELPPARGGHPSDRGLGGRGRGAAERRDHSDCGAISRRSPGPARRFVRADGARQDRGKTGPGSFDRWDGERSIAPFEFELMRAALISGRGPRGRGAAGRDRIRRAVARGAAPAAVGRRRAGCHPGPRPAPRRVRLLSPLRADLLEWREQSDANGDDDLVFPSPSGGHWKGGEWRDWIHARYRPLVAATGVTDLPPARLRNVFIALLVQEGISSRRAVRADRRGG